MRRIIRGVSIERPKEEKRPENEANAVKFGIEHLNMHKDNLAPGQFVGALGFSNGYIVKAVRKRTTAWSVTLLRVIKAKGVTTHSRLKIYPVTHDVTAVTKFLNVVANLPPVSDDPDLYVDQLPELFSA